MIYVKKYINQGGTRARIFLCISSFILGIAHFSCTKNFETVNQNPNAATDEQLKQDNLALGSSISQMENEIFPCVVNADNVDVNNYQTMYSLAGDVYSGHQGTSDAYGNFGVNNTTYSMIPGWYGTAFSVAYTNTMSPWYNIRKSATANPSAYAVAQILKVAMMHRITDMYGPLPYIGFVPSLNIPYNPQDSIYYSFFKELDSATIALKKYIALNGAAAKPLAPYDNIYKGDFNQWIKYANSLKLRLAMRIVYAAPDKARQYAEEAIAAGVFATNTDNAILTVDGTATVNALYQICYSYNDTRMGANMESFLKGYNDPRMRLWFKTAAIPNTPPDFHGIRNGSIFKNRDYQVFSVLNVNANTPIQIMTAAEVYFLRAEAALRGWAAGGSAQNMYEMGVTTAFSQSIGGGNASAGDATTYLQDDKSIPLPYVDPMNSGNSYSGSDANPLSKITIKWNDGEGFEKSLERIITQKWIALYPDGQEAWSEFRRTRYPRIFPIPDGNNKSGGLISTDVQIRRLPFPQDEYTSNRASVTIGVQKLGGPDNGGTKLWWDKKPN